MLDLLAAHDLVGLEAEVAALGPRASAERETLLSAPARGAARRCSTAPASSAARPSAAPPAAWLRRTRASPTAESPSGSASTSACCATSATTRARSSRSTTRPSGHVLGGGGRYDELMGRFGRPLPAVGFALYLERLHIAQAEEERMRREVARVARADPRARRRPAAHRAAPRGAVREARSTGSTRSASTPSELRGDSRSLVFEARGWCWSRCAPPTSRPTSRPAPPTSGSPARTSCMEQSDRAFYELLDLGYGACRMVVAAPAGDEHVAEHERRLGAVRIATKYPRIAERYFEDTGRQAEVIEVKGSVELAPLVGLADGDRRPRRHRQDPARERARGSRGDRAVHRAPRRQPCRPQAPRRRDRRARRPAAGGEQRDEGRCGCRRGTAPTRRRSRPAARRAARRRARAWRARRARSSTRVASAETRR